MEIKNSQKIDFLDEESIKKLEHGALQHRRFSGIEFKILKVESESKTITIQTTQTKSLSENYADLQKLIKLTKDLFTRYISDYKIHVQAIPYSHPKVDQLTTADIRNYMEANDLKIKDIEKLTGIDKTNLSAWLNDKRVMSQPVKSMFYFMIQSMENTNPFIDIISKKSNKCKFMNLKYMDMIAACQKEGSEITGTVKLTIDKLPNKNEVSYKFEYNERSGGNPDFLLDGNLTKIWTNDSIKTSKEKDANGYYKFILIEFKKNDQVTCQGSLLINEDNMFEV